MKPSPRSSEEVKEKIQNQNWQRGVGMLGEGGVVNMTLIRRHDLTGKSAGRIGEVELRMRSDINQ